MRRLQQSGDDMLFNSKLKKGDVLNNQQIHDAFKCGIRGGMRRSTKTNSLVLVSDKTRGIYKDVWKGSVLHFTGMGYVGDQGLVRQNRTLYESEANGVNVFLFEVFESGKYLYRGKARLAGKPYQGRQADLRGNMRNVWVFPLRVADGDHQEDMEDTKYQAEIEKAKPKEIPSTPQEKPGFAEVRGIRKWRTDPGIAKACIVNADYVCEVNPTHWTFTSKVTGQSYVEAHHLIPMAFQDQFAHSLDHQANIVSLCPNCHKLLHHAKQNEKTELLRLLLSNREGRMEKAGIPVTFAELSNFYI